MPGAILHIIAALASAAVIYHLHFKKEYGTATFVGNFLPDVLKFALAPMLEFLNYNMHITWTPAPSYWSWTLIADNINLWITLGAFIIGIASLLYQFHIIAKKTAKEYDELYEFLILGIITHIIMDILIPNQGFWI